MEDGNGRMGGGEGGQMGWWSGGGGGGEDKSGQISHKSIDV